MSEGWAAVVGVSITVRGSFRAKHQPERATVHVDVATEGATKDTVFVAATQTATTVAAHIAPLFDQDNGPVTWWSSDQVRTWSHRPWNKDGRQLPQIHHAGVQFRVTFSDFEALSRWLSTVASLHGVTITGIDWSLTEQRHAALIEDARTAAVHDARNKAQAYASSIGLGVVQPVALADAGMLGDQWHSPMDGGASEVALVAADLNGGQNGAELNFTPQDIELSAAVDARFLAG